MHKKTVLSLLFVVASVLIANQADATIVHHCSYEPDVKTPDIHAGHDAPEVCGEEGCVCGNTDDLEALGYDGECDHSSSFFWTFIQCSGGTCTMTGTIDCPGGDKSYQLTCPASGGNRAKARAGRSAASCYTPGGGNASCDCSSSGYFCGN